MVEPGESSAEKRPGVFVAVGGAVMVVGVVGFATIGYWYATDMGWTGYGSILVVSKMPIVFDLAVAAVCAMAGASMILVRSDVAAGSLGGVMLLATVVALSIAVVVGVRAYPQVEQAQFVAHGDASWRTRLPVTEVFGVLSETDDRITLEGRADRRGCNWVLRSVTIERATGRIVDVTELPTFLPAGEDPPRPGPVPLGFELIQGATPFICSN
jgi:hypothetical protein